MTLAGVSSLDNPLGFSSPAIVSAETIFQYLCSRKIGLDTVIPTVYAQCMDKFGLERFMVKMCLKPEGSERVISAELHHFSDTIVIMVLYAI